MSFRQRQLFNPSYSRPITVVEDIIDSKGIFRKEPVSQSKAMPKPEMFDLTNMLAAGVNLEEVNSKVLSASTVNADNVVRKYTKKSTSNNEE